MGEGTRTCGAIGKPSPVQGRRSNRYGLEASHIMLRYPYALHLAQGCTFWNFLNNKNGTPLLLLFDSSRCMNKRGRRSLPQSPTSPYIYIYIYRGMVLPDLGFIKTHIPSWCEAWDTDTFLISYKYKHITIPYLRSDLNTHEFHQKILSFPCLPIPALRFSPWI
jgi:hypothetical protein